MVEREIDAKEAWIKLNKRGVWQRAMGPIQARIQSVCDDKNELLRKLMDSKDEYFRFCKATNPPRVDNDTFIVRVGPDPCDECCYDPTIPMKTPPEHVSAILFEGIAREGGGYKGYLRYRWNSGLPETRFCYPPTTNSEYAWKIMENLQCFDKCSNLPRLSTIGPAFYRSRGVLCKADFAPYHFPRTYY